MGLSTCWLACGSKKAGRETVWAVDHFMGSPEHQPGAEAASTDIAEIGTTFPRFQANVSAMGLSEGVTPIQSASEAAAANWKDPIRLLFIDGDHSYEAAKQDFDLWSPFVVPAGS
jgi:hypothetical protein